MLVTEETVAYDLCKALDERYFSTGIQQGCTNDEFLKLVALEVLYLYITHDDIYKGAAIKFASRSVNFINAFAKIDGNDTKTISRRVKDNVDVVKELRIFYKELNEANLRRSIREMSGDSEEKLYIRNERVKARKRALDNIANICFGEIDDFMLNGDEETFLDDFIMVYLKTETLVAEEHYDEAYNKRVYMIKKFIETMPISNLIGAVLSDNTRIAVYNSIENAVDRDITAIKMTKEELSDEIQSIATALAQA